MSTPQPETARGRTAQDKCDSNQTYEPLDSEDEDVEHFLKRIQFFSTPYKIAAKILSLNQELGDDLIEKQLAALSREESADEEMIEVSENEVSGNWLHTIINRVSTILFHEEEHSEQMNLSEDELVILFQKTVSEKIYDRLGLLSLSPHAKKGGTFSLTEELTEGIAEDIGLGLYRLDETPDELRGQAKTALLNLAGKFQHWLVDEWDGVYTTGWGEIRARRETRDEEFVSYPIVWLEPDVKMQENKHM